MNLDTLYNDELKIDHTHKHRTCNSLTVGKKIGVNLHDHSMTSQTTKVRIGNKSKNW